MIKFIDKMMNSVKEFTFWDYFWFKFFLITFGMIIGTYFHEFLVDYVMLLWIFFVIAYIYIMYKTFKNAK